QCAVFPTRKSFHRSDPKRSIARRQQCTHVVAGQREPVWRLPRNRLDSIETKQTELGPQPQIAVWGLSDGVDDSLRKAVADLPRLVGVLIDIEGRIQRERFGA